MISRFRKSSFGFSAVFALIYCLSIGSSLSAQSTTGTISGTVLDQSGAVLPGVALTITHVETGAIRTIVTGNRGEYRISNLPPGSYQVQASFTGFQTGVRSGITLTVGRVAVVDFALSVGDVAEQVTVTGEAPLIETTTATVGGVVDSRQMRDIPLNARSFLELVPLQTNAHFAESGAIDSAHGFGKKLSISGTRYVGNSFLLDGADINDFFGTSGSAAGTVAGVETVREFRVITNAYDAEYGKHIGGVISAVTKSGTNVLHGTVFEFLRNDNLDARNFFDPDELPEFRRNQFGAAVGGPILRDKTFFFGSFEGLREGLGETKTFNVPGRDMREGIIGGEPIGVDPAIQPYLELYPAPQTPDRSDGRAQHFKAFTQTTDQDYWTGKVDHRFSDFTSIFGRITIDDADRERPAANGFNTTEVLATSSRFATLEGTHIFSPRLLSRTHFSFNRTRNDAFDRSIEGFTFPMERFTFGNQPDIPGRVGVSGLVTWGGRLFNPKKFVQNIIQFKEDIYFTTGRHSFKFGGTVERFQLNLKSSSSGGGTFDFGGLDDFLLNDVDRFRAVAPGSDFDRGWRESLFGFYLHDDISVSPGFTLNLGVRYEFITVPTEVNGKMANVRDTTAPRIHTVTPATMDIGDPYFLNPSLKNFAPRVGFAWDLFQSGKTSLRGGVGIFHDQILPSKYNFPGVRAAPFFIVGELRGGPDLDINFPNAFDIQRNLLTGRPQNVVIEYDADQPAVIKWSLDIQQQIASDTTLGAGYSATRGTHLIRPALNVNLTPSEFREHPDGGLRRFILVGEPQPNPSFGRFWVGPYDGTSDYHALRLSLQKRFSRGFQLQSSYTFSRTTDDYSLTLAGGDWGAADRNPYEREKEHGLAAFDLRQSFYTNFLVDLPGGNLTGAAGKLFGGWSVSNLLRFSSGNPFNLRADQPRLGSARMQFVGGPRLDLVPGGDQDPVRSQNPDEYFDPAQFSFPKSFFLGNVGRNHATTPGIANVDVTLMKETPLWRENTNLQFRAEFFNLFNRPNFGIPARSLFDRRGNRRSNAGEITTTRTTSRQIQFALKFLF